MTSGPDIVELHHHVARFVVALARLVELERSDSMSEADADHQGGYAVDAARKFALLEAGQLHVTFTARVPFVKRTPLQAAPWVFQRLELLASALHDHGWSDLRIEQTIRPEDVVELARLVAGPPDDDRSPTIPNVVLGAESFGDLATVVTVDRNARSTTLCTGYASVVAALWDARSAVARGDMPPLVRLTRAAQVTVDLACTGRMVATTPTSTRINDDTAARWVDTSVLAVEMCELVTNDRFLLRSVALAGLLLALAPFDERGAAGQDGPPSVSRGGRIVSPDRLAARTLGLLVGVPHVGRDARTAASLAFEAQRRRYRFLAASDASAFVASVEAVALATAIRFFELQARQSGVDVLDDVVGKLRAEAVDDRDDVALRMLLAALGTVPRGAVVELDTREIATVLSAAREGIPLEPEVEVLVDAGGSTLTSPRTLDLAKAPRDGERRRSLRAVLSWRVDGELPTAGSRDRAVEAESPRTAEKKSAGPKRDRERRKPALARPSSTPRPKSGVPLGLEILEDFVDPGEHNGGGGADS